MEKTRGLQRFLIGLLTLIITISIFIVYPVATAGSASTFSSMTESTTMVTEANIPSKTIETAILEKFQEHGYIEPLTSEEAQNRSGEVIAYIDILWNILPPQYEMENYKRAYTIVYPEIKQMMMLNKQYCRDYDRLIIEEEEAAKWAARAAEYPVATQVWLYMRDTLGWSESVCAGIMGNMMAECGGQTLNLNPQSRNSSSGCYGICQWHPRYYPDMQNANLETQLQFLGVSTEQTFNGWAGRAFGIDYKEFLSLTDYHQVAKYFNNVYERPGHYSSQRGKNAEVAYKYFVD